MGGDFIDSLGGSDAAETRGGGKSEGVTGVLSETGSESSLEAVSPQSMTLASAGGIGSVDGLIWAPASSPLALGFTVSRSVDMTQLDFVRNGKRDVARDAVTRFVSLCRPNCPVSHQSLSGVD